MCVSVGRCVCVVVAWVCENVGAHVLTMWLPYSLCLCDIQTHTRTHARTYTRTHTHIRTHTHTHVHIFKHTWNLERRQRISEHLSRCTQNMCMCGLLTHLAKFSVSVSLIHTHAHMKRRHFIVTNHTPRASLCPFKHEFFMSRPSSTVKLDLIATIRWEVCVSKLDVRMVCVLGQRKLHVTHISTPSQHDSPFSFVLVSADNPLAYNLVLVSF